MDLFKKKPTETELFVIEAMQQFSKGNDGDSTYHPLYQAWRSYKNAPEQLQTIQDYGRYGMAMLMFLSYDTISDIEDQQQIASISYLFLSKEIQRNNGINLYKHRLLLMIMHHEALEYTISSVVNAGKSIMHMNHFPFKARNTMYKMEFADLQKSPTLLNIGILSNRNNDLQNKIASGFFGKNETPETIITSGNKYHQEVLNYLTKKAIDNSDFNF